MNNDNPYYLGNRECAPTKLTVQTSETTISIDLPWDVSSSDMIQAFYTIMVGMTFSERGVLEDMKNFAEERLPNYKGYEDENGDQD